MPEPNVDIPERFEVSGQVPTSDAEVVVRARDRVLQREVLLKLPELGQAHTHTDRTAAQTALREARALARVRHAGVVGILEVLETANGPLLVLEPVPGETLAERLERDGPLAPDEVAALGAKLAGILTAVHAAGLVHRGLAADAVQLGADGDPRLTAFHFAKSQPGLDDGSVVKSSIQYSSFERKAGALPRYPSPEQFRGFPADARSDVFSLGAVLFRCLTGAAPFVGLPLDSTRAADVLARAPAAPPALANAIARCLALNPSARFQSAGELRAALESSADEPVAAAPRTSSGRRAALVGTAVALVLLVGTFALRGRLSPASGAGGERGLAGTRPGSAAPALHGRYERSHALLIGIGGAYADGGFPPLQNAERDVEALARRLDSARRDRWEVATLLGADATRDRVVDTLAALAERTADNDRVLIYYAGHGIAHERSETSGWMVPADGEPQKRSSWIRFDELFQFFGEARAKHILVAMDCCYGGRLTAVRAASASAYREQFLTRPAHVVIASGRLDEQVSDGVPGGHSPFAEALLDALSDEQPVTSTMLFARIQEAFTRRSVGHTPQFGYPDGSPAGGEFVFFAD